MATKRKQPFNPSFHSTSKRSRHTSPLYANKPGKDSADYSTFSRVDQTYGQRSAFPGLDGREENGEDALFYGPANDGLEYLRMVRSEAKSVPNLLIAKERAAELLEDQKRWNERMEGWYSDGAYTGAPPPSSQTDYYYASSQGMSEDAPGSGSDLDPQEAYYNALLTRFSRFREVLQNPPPTSTSYTPSTTPSQATLLSSSQPRWSYALCHTVPQARQLSCLSQEQVMRGLQRVESLITKQNLLHEPDVRNLGAWAWVLLGKCRSAGEMSGEEVAGLRDLAKTALWVGRKIRMAIVEKRAEDGRDDRRKEIEEVIGYEESYNSEDVEHGQEVDESETLGMNNDAVAEATETKTDIKGINGVSEAIEPGSSAGLSELEEAKRRVLQKMSEPNGHVSEAKPEEEQVKKGESGELSEEGEISEGEISEGPEDGENEEGDDLEKRALATLDIIVTIVGELYGQRDLLDAREVWGEYD